MNNNYYSMSQGRRGHIIVNLLCTCANIITGGQVCNEMEVLESRNVTKSFVPKLDVMSHQDSSQTDKEHSSKVDI